MVPTCTKPAGEWTYFWNPPCLFCQGDRTGWKRKASVEHIFAHLVLNGEIKLSNCTSGLDSTNPCNSIHSLCHRIGLAVEACSEQFDEECIAYGKAASSEEERTSLLYNVLSVNTDTNGLGLHDIHDEEDDDAIHR